MAISTISGNLTLADLASSLTAQEQLNFQQVTGLAAHATQVLNVVTTVDQPKQLGILSIVASGKPSPGAKLLSETVYVLGVKTPVDVYRLPA